MKTGKLLLSAAVALFACLPAITQQVNWTHFRGNNLDGISAEKGVPEKWSESSGIAWKTAIPGKGWSSPVVYGDQVWVTTATADGKEMFAVCVDFKSGKVIHNIKVFSPEKIQSKHNINTYATPTPCIEKEYVYVHFGTYGTACLKTSNGSVVWKRTDINCEHVQGPGSSPIIYKDMLIIHVEGTDVQYIAALNKKDGSTIWMTERPKDLYDKLSRIGKKAYITPVVIRSGGRDLLISNGSAVCIAYDVTTGKEVWRIVQGEDSTIAMPVADKETVYFISGFVTPKEGGAQYSELFAVDPSGTGDVAGTHIRWRMKLPTLQLLTPVIRNGLIYMIDTRNVLQCIEASSGNVLYTSKMKTKYNSSPVWADGKIYFTSMNGETMILKEGPKQEVISENKLDGEIYATPAILRKSIIMRTDSYLYRIGVK